MANGTKKSSDGGDDEWSFEIDTSELKQKNNEARGEARTKAQKPLLEKKMKVEQLKVEQRVSRTEMARKEGPLRVAKPDEHVPANLFLRGIAFIIDISFLAGLSAVGFFAVDTASAFYSQILNTIKMGNEISFETAIVINELILYFIFFIFPITITGKSLGKKLVGIKVRGIKYDGISFYNAIYRELLLKPVSMVLIFGFFMPLFNKKHRGIHDTMSQTIVVKDNGKFSED